MIISNTAINTISTSLHDELWDFGYYYVEKTEFTSITVTGRLYINIQMHIQEQIWNQVYFNIRA